MTEAEYNQSRMEDEAEEAYRNARKQRCARCGGWGIVVIPHYLVTSYMRETCPSCQGRGWMPKRPKRGE